MVETNAIFNNDYNGNLLIMYVIKEQSLRAETWSLILVRRI